MITKRLAALGGLATVAVLTAACATIQLPHPVVAGRPLPSTTTGTTVTVDGPMLVDDEGRRIPTAQARTIVAVYQALTDGDLDALHRLYGGSESGWSDQARLLSNWVIRSKMRHVLSAHPVAALGYRYPGFVTAGWRTAMDRADGRRLQLDPAAVPHPETKLAETAYTTDFAANGTETLTWRGIQGPGADTHDSASLTGATGDSLSGFVREWKGHTRSLTVSPSGIATEWIDSGCCDHVADLTMRLSPPRGATVSATVVTVNAPDWDGTGPPPQVGQTGTFTVHGGVLTESLTGATYCNDAEQMAGTCGA